MRWKAAVVIAVILLACGGKAGSVGTTGDGGAALAGSCPDPSIVGACADALRAFATCWNPSGACTCTTDDPPEVYKRSCTWESGATFDASFTPGGEGSASWSQCMTQYSQGAGYSSAGQTFHYNSVAASVTCADGQSISIAGCTTLKAALDTSWSCACKGPLC